MTPIQAARAMQEAAANACDDYAPERNIDYPTDTFIAQTAQIYHSMDRIRALDPADVLAGLQPSLDAVARLVEAARGWWVDRTPRDPAERELCAAIAAMEASHDRT